MERIEDATSDSDDRVDAEEIVVGIAAFMIGLPRKLLGSGGMMRGRRPNDISRYAVVPGSRFRAMLMRVQTCTRSASSLEILDGPGEEVASL